MSPAEHSNSLHTNSPIIEPVILDLGQRRGHCPAPAEAMERLLVRMRAGDRQAAADFLARYGSRIRRRIRGKLGSSMRRLFDSMEILSTLGRRLDLFVLSGQLKAASESQLWALVFSMADNALIDKARIFRRLQNTEGEDSAFAHQMMRQFRQVELERSSTVEQEIERCLNAVSDPIDRRIITLWLTGEEHGAIAEFVNLPPTAVRKRWGAIKDRLRERLAPQGC